MKIIDISQEVLSCKVYEGDPAPESKRIIDMADGGVYNLSALLSVHIMVRMLMRHFTFSVMEKALSKSHLSILWVSALLPSIMVT